MSCSCTLPAIEVPPSPLATSSITNVFFPLTGPQSTANIETVIARTYQENRLGNFTMAFGYQVSDDLVTWTDAGGSPGFSLLGSTTWDEDTPGDDSYITVSETLSLTKLFVRLGIVMKRDSTDLTAALMTTTFTFQNFQ